jgi:hypothetical protein
MNKRLTIKRGYLFAFLASLGIAILYGVKYEVFVKDNLNGVEYQRLWLKITTLFLIIFIPAWFLTRWYYKMKKKQSTTAK